jgi:hypothetical protein
MKFIRFLAPALTVLLLIAPILQAQDFSKYRDFSVGTSLATVLKRTEKKLADVSTTDGAPALFQEVTWWPPSRASSRTDSVEVRAPTKEAERQKKEIDAMELTRQQNQKSFRP